MKKEFSNLKIDKNAFSVTRVNDKSDDNNYWITKTLAERLRQIEILRRINYGHRATTGFQRILEITKQNKIKYLLINSSEFFTGKRGTQLAKEQPPRPANDSLPKKNYPSMKLTISNLAT